MSRESKAIKDEIQRNRDEAYLNGWNDGYAEGYGKATTDAPTFTAADLERAWEMCRDAGAERAAGRWATRSEHASRLFEMDYPEAEIDSKCYSHRADEADAIADEIRSLTPPADLAQRVKGPAHD